MNKKEINKRKNKILIILVILAILLVFSTFFAVLNSLNNNIINGISIQEIQVSGLNKEEVNSKFKNLLNKLNQKEIIFKYNEIEKGIAFSELNIKYNIEDAIDKACKIGRSQNIFRNNFDILSTMLFKRNIEIEINYDEKIIDNKIDYIMSILPGVVEEPSYYIDEDKLIINKGKQGISIDKEKLREIIKKEIKKMDSNIVIINIPTYYKEPEEVDIQKIHSEIYKEAKDAYITETPTMVHPNVNGVDFGIEIEEINKSLEEDKEEYIIPLKITIADKTINDLAIEAFPNLLGTFTTRYDPSNKNRSNNIELATDKLNGTIILPGEVFSYNKIVGKRTIEKGYKEAGAYAGGKVIQEVGGGICQVSSTLYNAVLYANLAIIERSNHYFETTYVDVGRDATVSWGTVDFKFKNNRAYPIKIEATSKNGVMKISIRGIKEEKEYEVIIKSETTSIIEKNIKYLEDSKLNLGEEKIVQVGHDGSTSKTYKILRLNGITVSTEIISEDYYHPLEKIIKKRNI